MTDTAAVAVGDCYEAAVRLAETDSDMFICHGYVTGSPDTKVAGVRFSHAWCEKTVEFTINGHTINHVEVFDHSNGRDIDNFPAQLYYKLGDIDAAEVVRYTYTEAVVHMVTTEHWGPWDED